MQAAARQAVVVLGEGQAALALRSRRAEDRQQLGRPLAADPLTSSAIPGARRPLARRARQSATAVPDGVRLASTMCGVFAAGSDGPLSGGPPSGTLGQRAHSRYAPSTSESPRAQPARSAPQHTPPRGQVQHRRRR